MSSGGFLSHHHSPRNPKEGKSLDLVQRVILSVLIAFVLGAFSSVLALYLVWRGRTDLPESSVVGLWVMSGIIGLITMAGILLLNRRKAYHPLILIGLVPMAIAGYYLFVASPG